MLSRRALISFASVTGLLVQNYSTFVRAEDDDGDDIEDNLDDDTATGAATDPVELTDSSLADEVAKLGERPMFVVFHAPWCGHCKKMMPAWEELAAEQNGQSKGCLVARVDATAQRQLAESFQVRGFPTIKMVTSEKVYEYDGGRTKADFTKFCTTDAWKESNSVSLPWKQTMFEKAEQVFFEYLEKAGQVHNFEPTLLPIIFIVGLFLGLFSGLGIGMAARATPAKDKKEEETTKEGGKGAKAEKSEGEKKKD